MGCGTGHPEGLGYHTGEESYNPQISLPTDKWTGRWFAEQLATSVIPGIFAISAVSAHGVDLMQRRGVWAVRKPYIHS